MEDPAAFYATIAQVIPTLLVAAALEYSFLHPDGTSPTKHEVRADWPYYVIVALCIVMACVGAVAALTGLAFGDTPTRQEFSLAGAVFALLLVGYPIYWRAVASILPEREFTVRRACARAAIGGLVAALAFGVFSVLDVL